MDQKCESYEETKICEVPPSAPAQQETFSTGQGIIQYLVTKYRSANASALHGK